MQSDFIARIIALVQKHGDRVVVADPSVGRAVVVLDLADYERLRDGGATPSDTPVIAPTPVIASVSEAISPPVIPAEAGIQKKEPPQPPQAPSEVEGFAHLLAKTIDSAPQSASLTDLTQEQLIDKINRDIGAWKTAQDRKRTDELKSALQPEAAPVTASEKKRPEDRPQPAPRTQPNPPIEDEERFFLEPIE